MTLLNYRQTSLEANQKPDNVENTGDQIAVVMELD